MIGTRLGKWVIDKAIGHGGMGRVYLAHEEANGQQAALKVLAASLAQEPGFLQRFQREIHVLSQLQHPNIVRFYESGTQDGHFYFAMEYVEGESFEQLLHKQGRIPWKEVLDAAVQICPALKHAHDHGIIHRDIKPPNLMRTPTGTIKLTDFGIAKVFASRQLTNTGGVVGTAEYLSPEQATGKAATKRSDLYSLGVVLYTLLTGRTPFEGESTADILHKHLYAQFDRPLRIVPEIPAELDQIVCQLLEKDPERRPADGMVLLRQFDSLRRKIERKSQPTYLGQTSDRTVADTKSQLPSEDSPGPATLMSQMVRQELEQQKHGGVLSQWLNKPWVLLPLFLLCVAILVWRFWPEPTAPAEVLFQRASELMASSQTADWDKAWNEYLVPLDRTYPDHPYHKDVEEFRQKIDDQAALQRALGGIRGSSSGSEAEHFYQRGLRLCQEGDTEGARQIWQSVIRTFGDIESEKRWVRLCESGLTELNSRASTDEPRRAAALQALQHARQLRDQGRRQQAEEIWQGLEELYRNDKSADEILQQVRRDRGE